jgi:L-ribulokinase
MIDSTDKQHAYVIGVDYGTDSVRALLVNGDTGEEIALSVFEYPRWKKGLYCNASYNQFRQHPSDYIEGLEFTVRDLLSSYPDVARFVKAISIDTTGSTPVAVDENSIPLSMSPRFSENPNAMFVLWKDHTAIREADEINHLCRTWGGPDYTKYSGGIYSSEWFWSKILHIIRKDPEIEEAAASWMEHCDWIPAMLTGNTRPDLLKRSRCSAGHKALWHKEWGGFPQEDFLAKLDPGLVKVKRSLNNFTLTSDQAVGYLTQEWAGRLGLNTSVHVGSGVLDAHVGAVGGEIKPYHLSKVIGTSTCDMLVAPSLDMDNVLVKGICGQVDGSIMPGMEGMEAGQSAFGDIYAWFKKLLMWPIDNILASSAVIGSEEKENLRDEISSGIIAKLAEEAAKIPVGESSIIALDWMNGRRTPDADQSLKGAISGLTLGSDAPCIFKAFVEATAFGSKAIIDRFISEGVRVEGVIALGGVAKKSPFVMQTLADVLNMPIQTVQSEQTCALGAAMCASVVAGIQTDLSAAQKCMGKGFDKTYIPCPENVALYKRHYDRYCALGKRIEELNGLEETMQVPE